MQLARAVVHLGRAAMRLQSACDSGLPRFGAATATMAERQGLLPVSASMATISVTCTQRGGPVCCRESSLSDQF